MNEKRIICDAVMDLLPLYVENACSPESEKMISEHLEECPLCKSCLKEWKEKGEISEKQEKRIARKRVRRELQGVFSDVLLRISRVVRFVPLVMYVVIAFVLIKMEFSGVKYPHIRWENKEGFLFVGLYEVLIPCICLFFCFIKGKKVWKSLGTILVSIGCSWYLIFISIVGMLGAGMLVSDYTCDVLCYEEVLAERQSDGEFAIFPEKIPAGVSDVEFVYERLNEWDPEYRIELKLRFLERTDYETEMERLNTSKYKKNLYGEEKEGEICFVCHHGSDEAVCYYDEDTLEMYYGVRLGRFCTP